MSEPVTNTDIEDVLSSIRRLISDNPGKENDSDAPAASADKLVLTPAFRVLDGDGGDGGDGGENTPESSAPEQADSGSAQDVTQGVAAPDTPDLEIGDKDGLEQRIAELEAAIGESYEEWEPDGSEYEDGDAAASLHPAPEAPAQWDVIDDQEAQEATITAMPSPAGIVLEAEEIFDEEGEADDDMAEDADADEELVIDEEMLREIVAQLVREQLKGQIGEKITRSIRRMVRREIRLALAVRDTE